MAQPSDPRNCDDLTHFPRFDRPFFGSVLLESEMRSVFVVVGDIRPNHSAELRLIDRDHVVEAVFS
jgi:hypothetical protein